MYEKAKMSFGCDLNDPSQINEIWKETIKINNYENKIGIENFYFQKPKIACR